jgi:hypothetical protein
VPIQLTHNAIALGIPDKDRFVVTSADKEFAVLGEHEGTDAAIVSL